MVLVHSPLARQDSMATRGHTSGILYPSHSQKVFIVARHPMPGSTTAQPLCPIAAASATYQSRHWLRLLALALALRIMGLTAIGEAFARGGTMAEYQHYEFVAIDRPLSQEEQEVVAYAWGGTRPVIELGLPVNVAQACRVSVRRARRCASEESREATAALAGRPRHRADSVTACSTFTGALTAKLRASSILSL